MSWSLTNGMPQAPSTVHGLTRTAVIFCRHLSFATDLTDSPRFRRYGGNVPVTCPFCQWRRVIVHAAVHDLYASSANEYRCERCHKLWTEVVDKPQSRTFIESPHERRIVASADVRP
jgi:hypothetical protein